MRTVFVSGGAAGADLAWTIAAKSAGFEVEIVSFRGHHCLAPQGCTARELGPEELVGLDPDLARVSRRRNIRLSNTGYVLNLLRRNIYIARDVDAIYAVTKLPPVGGTAWACIYAEMEEKGLFVFDLQSTRWMACRRGVWVEEVPQDPRTFGRVGLIGSRFITEAGRVAIKELFGLIQ